MRGCAIWVGYVIVSLVVGLVSHIASSGKNLALILPHNSTLAAGHQKVVFETPFDPVDDANSGALQGIQKN